MEKKRFSITGIDAANRSINRNLAITIIVGCTLWFVCRTIDVETHRFKYDFAAYYTCWYAARNDLPFYDPLFGKQGGDSPALSQLARQAGIPKNVPYYLYPPSFAALGHLMPSVSYRTAEIFATWANGIIWLTCIGVLVLVFFPREYLAQAGLFAMATIYPPADFTIKIGQPNIVVFLLLVIMFWALVRKFDILAGIVIGLAILAKAHLGFFVIYFLVKRCWKAVISTTFTLVALVLFSIINNGTDQWYIFLNDVLPASSRGLAYIGNQSVHGFLARIVTSNPVLLYSDSVLPGGATLSVISRMASFIILTITVVVIARARKKSHLPTEVSVVILGLLLAAPVATIHHFTWCYFAIIVLWSRMYSFKASRRQYQNILICIGTLLLFLPWESFFQIFLRHNGWPRLLACNTFLGTLLLWLASLHYMRYPTFPRQQLSP